MDKTKQQIDVTTPLTTLEAGRAITIFRSRNIKFKYRELVDFSPEDAAALYRESNPSSRLTAAEIAEAAGRKSL